MGIRIKITDDWVMKSDSKQYMLVKVDGESEVVVGYYQDIESCLEALIDKEMKESDATTIQTLLTEIKTLQGALNRAIRPLKLVVAPISDSVKKK